MSELLGPLLGGGEIGSKFRDIRTFCTYPYTKLRGVQWKEYIGTFSKLYQTPQYAFRPLRYYSSC